MEAIVLREPLIIMTILLRPHSAQAIRGKHNGSVHNANSTQPLATQHQHPEVNELLPQMYTF
jgi:hypothetical protein